MANLKNTNIDDNLELPSGTTAERPASPQEGQIRYNTDLGVTEFYNGANWRPLSDTHPEATGGTVVDTDIGGVPYRIHYFTETGTNTLTVTNPGEVEYLIVAGGGSGGAKSLGTGGGSAGGGGGGAGGVVLGKTKVSSQTYSIIVGAGGPSVGNEGEVSNTKVGRNGEDSQAFGLTAIGGGGGGGNGGSGVDGGSGGGSGNIPGDTPGSALQPASSSGGFGNSGGSCETKSNYPRGGGGGAGSAGKDGVASKAGDGGQGIMSGITGTNQFYAGGGGGSWRNGSDISGAAVGGLGGGSNGGIQNSTQIGAFPGEQDIMLPAQANTGGGGGGQGGYDKDGLGSSSAGGSGIVIVRYPRNSSLNSEPDETRPSFQPYNYVRDVRPIIVRDGLVLELDAANPLSYPGSGTVWTDLSGNGNNVSIQTSPVKYTDRFFGSFPFEGKTNDFMIGPYISTVSKNTNYTISAWVFPEGSGVITQISSGGSDRNGFVIVGSTVRFGYYDGSSWNGISASINLAQWQNITATFVGKTQKQELYINGKLALSQSSSLYVHTGSFYIGKTSNDQDFYSGNISGIFIYNRTLPESEIQQNFNATRSRYGV